MSLMALPPEIFFTILGYTESELRKRVNLLCISKPWYSVAQIVHYRNVHLSSRSLSRLPPPLIRHVRLLTSNARSLSILFKREDWKHPLDTGYENYNTDLDEQH